MITASNRARTLQEQDAIIQAHRTWNASRQPTATIYGLLPNCRDHAHFDIWGARLIASSIPRTSAAKSLHACARHLLSWERVVGKIGGCAVSRRTPLGASCWGVGMRVPKLKELARGVCEGGLGQRRERRVRRSNACRLPRKGLPLIPHERNLCRRMPKSQKRHYRKSVPVFDAHFADPPSGSNRPLFQRCGV